MDFAFPSFESTHNVQFCEAVVCHYCSALCSDCDALTLYADTFRRSGLELFAGMWWGYGQAGIQDVL